MFTSSRWTYKRIILAQTILIFPVMCSSREAGWKKVSRHFETVPPLGYRAYSLSTPKRRRPVMSGMMSSKSGHGLERQQGVWLKSGLETNSLSSAWQTHRELRPAPHTRQVSASPDMNDIQDCPKNSAANWWKQSEASFFSDQRKRLRLVRGIIFFLVFSCDSTCNLLEAVPRRVSSKVYLSDLKLTTVVKIRKTWSVL